MAKGTLKALVDDVMLYVQGMAKLHGLAEGEIEASGTIKDGKVIVLVACGMVGDPDDEQYSLPGPGMEDNPKGQRGIITDHQGWCERCAKYGLREADFHRLVSISGETYRIEGLKPRNTRYPILLAKQINGAWQTGWKASPKMICPLLQALDMVQQSAP